MIRLPHRYENGYRCIRAVRGPNGTRFSKWQTMGGRLSRVKGKLMTSEESSQWLRETPPVDTDSPDYGN